MIDMSTYHDKWANGEPIERVVVDDGGTGSTMRRFVSFKSPDGHQLFMSDAAYNSGFTELWRNSANQRKREKMGIDP